LTKRGSSLLPSGIIGVETELMNGALVSIVDAEGVEFANGLQTTQAAILKRLKECNQKKSNKFLHLCEEGTYIRSYGDTRRSYQVRLHNS